jgi:hypothetical protein
MGIPEDQEFVKSFREGSKILIARRGGNRTGRFLEATVFGLGSWKGFIIIPEGRGGWGWQKFSGELCKAVDFLFATVGSRQGSSSSSTKKDVKVLRPSLGLASKWTGPSFAEVLCSVPTFAVNKLPLVGELRSGLRASPEELGVPIPAPTHAEQVLSSAVGCPHNPLVKDRSLDSMGKKPPPHSNLNFERSMMRTWGKLVNGLKVVLGRTIRSCLGRLVGSVLGRKCSGFCLARLLPKPKAHSAIEPSTPSFPGPSRPEPSSSAVLGALMVGSSSSGFSLVRPPRGLEAVSLGKGIAVPGVSFAFPAPSLRLETSSPTVPGAFPVRSSSSGGGSSCLKVDPSRVTASSLAVSHLSASPSAGEIELGEKLCSSPPVVSKPFQRYIRKARVLREGVSWKWNDVLLSDSLKASKMVADLAVYKASVAEPPAKKVVEPPVKEDFLRKGFLNPRPIFPTTSSSPQKVFDGGIVGPSSPPRGCSSSSPVEDNGFSQSRNWPIGFDHNGEIVVWEEDIDFWDVLPLDWASKGAFGEEALAIRDAMEEEF